MNDLNSPNESSGGVLNTVPLNDAVTDGKIDLVKSLLKNGALVDGLDETAITPLMEAAREENSDIVKLLLENGANVRRMGFIQRFYALDFAYWRAADERTVKYLREAGGIKVDDEIDWKSQVGWPVIFHVSRNYAAVYPSPFPCLVAQRDVNFWLAQVREEESFLYLFSAGLYDAYKIAPRVDVALIIPSEWAILESYSKNNTIFSFPLEFLSRVSARVASGVIIEAGYLISAMDSDFSELCWPSGVKFMVAVDQVWREDLVDVSAGDSAEDVKIYTFAPISLKSFDGSIDSGMAVAKKLSAAKTKKLALPYYWKELL